MTASGFSLAGCRPPGVAAAILALGLLAAAGCDSSNSPLAPGLGDCRQIAAALEAELASIQACSETAQCGQVLTGTSCGCTRDLVARLDAGTARFYAIVERGQEMQCPATEFATTCDCPTADGFACVDGRCDWNYL